jgi:hypothetical protein
MNDHPPDIPGTGEPGKGQFFACPDRLHAKMSPLANPICLHCDDRPPMEQVSLSEYQRIRTANGLGDDL